MKRKSPYLMITTLFCVLFFSACQKTAGLLPQDNNSTSSLIGPIDPVEGIRVPLAGNAFIIKPSTSGSEAITATGLSNWTDKDAIASTYFRIGKTGQLYIAINASVPSGTSTIKVSLNGQSFNIEASGSTTKKYRVGVFNITKPGYIRVDLQGVSNTNNSIFANVSDVVIYGSATTSNLTFANVAANYKASRAGAGVRLEYNLSGQKAQWFYNELTVPMGSEIEGTNYISNGFDVGNAGLQITSSGQKRITFFVAHPAGDVTSLVRKGINAIVDASVTSGKFVYLPFDWKSGTTYKFITQAKTDGSGNTTYSAWVYTPEDEEWKVIASFIRQNTESSLTGLYSSLQGINPENGFIGRKVRLYNQWINTNDTWTELNMATFRGNATAMNNQRNDYGASSVYSSFNLECNGFFSSYLPLNSDLKRILIENHPSVDLVSLP